MSYTYFDQPGFDYDKSLEIDVNTDIDFNANVMADINKNIDVDIAIDTNIKGNTAILVADVEAIGQNTFVEVDTSVLAVEGKLSSISIIAIAAVA